MWDPSEAIVALSTTAWAGRRSRSREWLPRRILVTDDEQLYHTMMAFSSLSLAYREGKVDSLAHYKQIFPSLSAVVQSDKDMTSDGVLFTHFFLLFYDVSDRLRTR